MPQLPQPAPPAPAAPPVIDLYNAALKDYMAARYPLAISEFGQVIHAYPNDPLAGNSYYYLGEIDYRAGKFSAAIKDYDQVLNNTPPTPRFRSRTCTRPRPSSPSKSATPVSPNPRAHPALPQLPEAAQARTRLNGMGVRPAAAR